MKKKYTYPYPKADHTVDAVLFSVDFDRRDLMVLLVRRRDRPFKGSLALPGGFVHMREDLEASVRRELEEETGLRAGYLDQLYTFGDPERDPRGRVISTAFMGLIPPRPPSAGSDAKEALWHPVGEILGNPSAMMAFDHYHIVLTALRRLRSKLLWQPVGIELLPADFSLRELQDVYEVVLGERLDKRNFRSKMLAFGVLTPTRRAKGVRHRPPQLYRFDRDRYDALNEKGLEFEI